MNPNFTSVMEGAAESTATARAVGFRFHPRDDELVNYYLRYKLLGENTGSISIPEIKVYSFDPWELLGRACSLLRISDVLSNQNEHNKVRLVIVYHLQENFTLCKLKRKRDKRINKNDNKLDHRVTMHSSREQCHPISDVGKSNPSYKATLPNAFDCENQRPPLLGGNGCSSIVQTTCDSSEASRLVISDFGNQTSPSCEYSEANCMKISDFLTPITPPVKIDDYQVCREYSEASCLVACDLRSHVSPLKDDGCSSLVMPSKDLESHSIFENDKLYNLVDSVSGIHPHQTVQVEQPTPYEGELYNSAAPSLEAENEKLLENSFLTRTNFGDWVNSAFPEISQELIDLMVNY
ncbi:unnamed protein product [Linum tenue]|uniref:NAC domain-containing protein n=1 Tax=Linum tenue TaxID=586396 RepID=A0AAV0LG86_9ROSI|nr:unnamed protein product [Linum tenue]